MDAFTNRAWLLSITGKAISVLHHPAANFEFYNIPVILLEHGSELEQEIARGFIDHPTEEQKQIVLALYHKNWCKVRVWGCFSEEVLFRIPEHNVQWKRVIADFLSEHRRFERAKITIEITG